MKFSLQDSTKRKKADNLKSMFYLKNIEKHVVVRQLEMSTFRNKGVYSAETKRPFSIDTTFHFKS
jgi:hypothetical protein